MTRKSGWSWGGRLSILVLAASGLTACLSPDDGWIDETNYKVPQVGGPDLAPHLQVPQIAFDGTCPDSLDFYLAQLQDPDRPPAYVTTPVAEIVLEHGSKDAAEAALTREAVEIRKNLKAMLEARPVNDLQARRRADMRLGRLSAQLLATQAMLAAVSCEGPPKTPPGTAGRSRQRR